MCFGGRGREKSGRGRVVQNSNEQETVCWKKKCGVSGRGKGCTSSGRKKRTIGRGKIMEKGNSTLNMTEKIVAMKKSCLSVDRIFSLREKRGGY